MKLERGWLLILLVSWAMILVSGCAKNEAVKKDEPLAFAPATSAPVDLQWQKEHSPVTLANLPSVRGEIVPEAGGSQAGSGDAIAVAELKRNLESIYFNFDSAHLSEQSRGSLVKDAELIQIIGDAKIRVEGNCDERGSDEYNLALGDQRAKAAVRYLVSLGVPADRITSVSFGKERSVCSGHDDASCARNRRDDFVVLP